MFPTREVLNPISSGTLNSAPANISACDSPVCTSKLSIKTTPMTGNAPNRAPIASVLLILLKPNCCRETRFKARTNARAEAK